jgi:hypothetical protein
MPRSVLVPDVGDAVLLNGVKYRIRTILLNVARLVPLTGPEEVVDPRSLQWNATRDAWTAPARRTDRCAR